MLLTVPTSASPHANSLPQSLLIEEALSRIKLEKTPLKLSLWNSEARWNVLVPRPNEMYVSVSENYFVPLPTKVLFCLSTIDEELPSPVADARSRACLAVSSLSATEGLAVILDGLASVWGHLEFPWFPLLLFAVSVFLL